MIIVESGFAGTLHPLTHPRIGASPVSGTVTASTEATGFDADYAANDNTYEGWKPTAVPATWDLVFAASAPVSYVGIAGHTLGTALATVAVQRWNGAAWVTMASHSPTDDSPILFLLERRTLDRLRVLVSGAVAVIAVVYIGDVIEFPRPCRYNGSTAFDLSDQDEYRDIVSDGGHVLERFVTRRSIPVKMEVANLSEAWAVANLAPLRTHLKTRPIFIADRPGTYPSSVAFGRTMGPLQLPRDKPQAEAAIAVTFEVIGHVSA